MKLGCSLQEAFGETWESKQKFGLAPMEAFHIRDPYGPYGNQSAFGDVSRFSKNNTSATGASGGSWDAQSPWAPQWGEIPQIITRLETIEKNIKDKSEAEQRVKIIPQPEIEKETFVPTQQRKEKFSIMTGLCDYFNSGTIENILLFVMIFIFVNNAMEILS